MKRTLLLTASLMTAGSASAHMGIGSTAGIVAGFEHPFFGIDHVTTMIAVGLWAASKGGRAVWVWPASFVIAMVFGGGLGLLHVPLPFVEPGILASMVILGLLVATASNLPVAVGAVIVTAFAILHGHAHGAEAPATNAGLLYLGAFAVATSLLHGIGISIALAAGHRWHSLVRVGGMACATLGVGLAAGVFG